MNICKSLVRLLLLGSFLFTHVAIAAKSDTEIERLVKDEIKVRHPREEPEWWRGLGVNTPKIIIRLYKEEKQISHQMRLMQALSWFDTPEATEFLKEEAQRTDLKVIRTAAIRTIVNSQGVKELDFVSEFLSHAEVQTRLEAAKGIKRMGLEVASEKTKKKIDKILDRYEYDEKEAWVIQRLHSQKVPLRPTKKKGLAGKWEGYWMTPDSSKKGLTLKEVSLSISKSAQDKGEIELRPSVSKGKVTQVKSAKWSLHGLKLSGSRLTGTLSNPLSRAFPKGKSSDPFVRSDIKGQGDLFEGKLIRGARGDQVRIYIPALEATLVARRVK